jgi:outer membrane immunogenic protein
MRFLPVILLLLVPSLVLGQASGNNPVGKKRYRKAVSHRYNWNGFYGGVNGGFGVANNSTQFSPLPNAAAFFDLAPTTLNPNTIDGYIGGAQIGRNWQMEEWVFGLETDFQTGPAADISQAPISAINGTPEGGSLQTSEKTDWFGTFRVRGGFTPIGRLLIYLTGGFAYGSVNYSAATDFQPAGKYDYSASYNKIKMGWTAGAGAEWVLQKNFSLKAEYLYYDLGDESATAIAGPIPNSPYEVGYEWQTKVSLFRIGLNYKFF